MNGQKGQRCTNGALDEEYFYPPSNRQLLVRRFMGKSLLFPAHSQKTAFPATLHTILRVDKTPQNSRPYEGTTALLWVLDQTLAIG
jgi:hypothetical protein